MTPCTHDNVGRMVPHFPKQWACLHCGQQFVSTDVAQPAPDPLREALDTPMYDWLGEYGPSEAWYQAMDLVRAALAQPAPDPLWEAAWSYTCDGGDCDEPSICLRREADGDWYAACLEHASHPGGELAPICDATPTLPDVDRLARAVRSHRDPVTGEPHCGIACVTAIAEALEAEA